MDIQLILVYIIMAIAVGYVVRSIIRTIRRKPDDCDTGCCSGCNGCPSAHSSTKETKQK